MSFSTYDYRNQAQALMVLGYLNPSPPDPVNDLAATTLTDTSVQLNFTPVTGADGYQYRINGGAWNACTDTSGVQAVTGLTANTAYTFEVRAHGLGGYSDPSNTASATTYAAQTQAFLSRISAQTSSRRTLYNNLFLALISAGILTKLECLWVEAAADSTTARTNLISSSYTLTPVGGPTFTVDRGYAPDGSTSYLDTNFNPSSGSLFTQNSASLGCWLNSGDDTSTSNVALGAGASTTGASFVVPWVGGNIVRGRVNATATVNTAATSLTRLGFSALSRVDAVSLKGYKNANAGSGVTSASTSPVNANVYLGGTNSGGSLTSATNNRHAADFIGSGLNDTEMLALYNALNTFLTAIGGN